MHVRNVVAQSVAKLKNHQLRTNGEMWAINGVLNTINTARGIHETSSLWANETGSGRSGTVSSWILFLGRVSLHATGREDRPSFRAGGN